jgi:hypothetical protein
MANEINAKVEQFLKGMGRRHPSPKELRAYHEARVQEASRSQIEEHIKGCLICERRLEVMQEMLQAETASRRITAADRARIKRLMSSVPVDASETERPPSERDGVIERLVNAVAEIILPPIRIPLGVGASGATSLVAQKRSGEEHGVWWSLVENEWGDWEVRLGSYRTELSGKTLEVKAGEISKFVTLTEKGENQVGGEVAFTSEEWGTVREEPHIQILDPAIEGGGNHE